MCWVRRGHATAVPVPVSRETPEQSEIERAIQLRVVPRDSPKQVKLVDFNGALGTRYAPLQYRLSKQDTP